MENNTIFKISAKIKEIRKEKSITLQELADKANVSKGLISQIENNRTVPSLLVLINIVNALEVDLNVFFHDFKSNADEGPIIVRKKPDYEVFEKEMAFGFLYNRIFATSIESSTLDIVLLELAPDATRPMVETEAFEYKYIVSGTVEYVFSEQSVRLDAGDSIFFDGRIPHTPKNTGSIPAVMLIIYFFDKKGN